MARIQMAPVRRAIRSDVRESDRGSGKLLIFILSAFVVLAAARGISHLTGLPFLFAFLAAAILCITKMYFLRDQPPQEAAMSNGWDRSVAYVVTAFFSVALAAFGLYGFTTGVSANATKAPPIKNQLVVRAQAPIREQVADSRPPRNDLFHDQFDLGGTPEDRLDYEAPLVSPMEEPTPIVLHWEIDEAPPLPERFVTPLPDEPREKLISSLTGASKRDVSSDGLRTFLRETFEQNTYALGCWLAPTIFEAIILVLACYNRPRVYYYY